MKTSNSLLINLSNHPLSSWPTEQREAALRYGTTIDMDFPSIPPSASEEDIDQLAHQYLHLIINQKKDNELTVHIMGEMTFTFAVVNLLKAHNIPCIASCTERVVEEIEGKKISEFHFRKFRKY